MSAITRLLKSFLATSAPVARTPHKARLGVEWLEGRDLPAASLTASFSSGFLRVEGTEGNDVIYMKQSTSGQISVNGIAIATPSGSVPQVSASQVARIVVFGLGGDDDIRLERGQDYIRARSLIDAGAGNDTIVGGEGFDVIVGGLGNDSLRGGAGDDVLIGGEGADWLDGGVGDNRTYEHTLTRPNGVHVGAQPGVHSLTVEPSGFVLLQNEAGELYRFAGGQPTHVGSYVVKAGAIATGAVHLTTAGNLYIEGTSGAWANVRDFEVDPAGRVVVLNQNGILERRLGGGWEGIGTNVKKFAVGPDGSVTHLTTGGGLYAPGRGVWGNTQDFALAADGTLYWHGTAAAGGRLQKLATGSSTWVDVALDTVKFAVAPNGTCYSLGGNGWLHVNGQGTWGNTRDFAVDPAGRLLVVNVNGLLQRLDGPGWANLDHFVQSVSVDTAGQEVRGYTPIGQKWRDSGREAGVLGLPVGATIKHADGTEHQDFEKGVIHSLTNGETFAASGGIWMAARSSGLGLPTGNPFDVAGGLRAQVFQNGVAAVQGTDTFIFQSDRAIAVVGQVGLDTSGGAVTLAGNVTVASLSVAAGSMTTAVPGVIGLEIPEGSYTISSGTTRVYVNGQPRTSQAEHDRATREMFRDFLIENGGNVLEAILA